MEGQCRAWFIRTCGVCLITSVFVFVCCVYCTVLLQRMTELSRECATNAALSETGRPSAPLEPQFSSEDEEQNPLETGIQYLSKNWMRHTDDDGSLKEPAITRIKRASKRKPADSKSKSRKKKGKMKAAHYESMVTEQYIAGFPNYADGNLTKTCFYVEEMAGTLCRTKDFITNNSRNAIRSFKPASWVSKRSSPFDLKDNGFFIARYSGLYLIYAQVLFYDNKQAQVLQLVQMRKEKGSEKQIQSLTCHESVDKADMARYNSCGVTGLFSLNKNDVIYLENVFADVTLNLQISTTYLGAVLLK